MTKCLSTVIGMVAYSAWTVGVQAVPASAQPDSGSPDEPFGRRNPNAPKELQAFDFLIGHWRCDVITRKQDGSLERAKATWTGRYILDGFVIADEYRQFDEQGETTMLGVNYRSYSRTENRWVMRWFDALQSTWLEMGPADLGGVHSDARSVHYQHRAPPDVIVRITYAKESREHFIWSAETSEDGGESWRDTGLTIKAYRVQPDAGDEARR